MIDPFFITGPAVISFSGGRTSAYMLWRILQAHGGRLPSNVIVVFCNTGREMEATLAFVAACAAAWNVPVVWLEFVARREDGFAVVSHNSAARNGEPFDALLGTLQALPNAVQRSCTTELKIRTITRYCTHMLGWQRWANVIGLRADETRRVEKAQKPARERWTRVMPLADAGIALADVRAFWREQPFDLELAGPWEGNCDGCFLKSYAAMARMFADHPARMEWWLEKEAAPRGTAGVNCSFRNRDRKSYADLRAEVRTMPRLPVDETMIEGGEACDGYCGV